MSAQPEPTTRETRWVDPGVLVTRANVRAVAEPDPELVASIRVHGVLQPPLVYPDGEDLVLIAGHRRTAAAIAVGLERIEVVVGPRMDDQLRIAAQVSENTNRAGLRAVEISDAVEQMALLGVPAGQIAKAAGLRKAQVEAARKVAAANKAVKEAIIDAPDLTLDQAAELTSWGEDPDAVADLLAAAEDGEVSFAHTRSRLADQRERREAITAAEDGWIAKGYLVIQPEGSSRSCPRGPPMCGTWPTPTANRCSPGGAGSARGTPPARIGRCSSTGGGPRTPPRCAWTPRATTTPRHRRTTRPTRPRRRKPGRNARP